MQGSRGQSEETAKFLEEYAKKTTRPSLDGYVVRVRKQGRGLTTTRIAVKLKARDATGKGQTETSPTDP